MHVTIAAAAANSRATGALSRTGSPRCWAGSRAEQVAMLGLAFKAGTDDVRDSPAVEVARRLLAGGAVVRGHDPAAAERAVRAARANCSIDSRGSRAGRRRNCPRHRVAEDYRELLDWACCATRPHSRCARRRSSAARPGRDADTLGFRFEAVGSRDSSHDESSGARQPAGHAGSVERRRAAQRESQERSRSKASAASLRSPRPSLGRAASTSREVLEDHRVPGLCQAMAGDESHHHVPSIGLWLRRLRVRAP